MRFFNCLIQEKVETSAYRLFSYTKLQETLYKKRITDNPGDKLEIVNDLNGFMNYFTSKNLRKKIFHPLFIAFKFSNAVTLHVDESLWSDNVMLI